MGVMSQAFIREAEGERWQAPERRPYHVIEPERELLSPFETDDLFLALAQLKEAQTSAVLVRKCDGAVLATKEFAGQR